MIYLSLIVPIYGVEKYIDRFLYSLEKNLQSGIEVLLIDDGTRDNSGKIADKFALLHADNVKVVHKENGGASSARNLGLDIARGKYVIFPDSDDYLSEDYVAVILNSIKKYNEPDMIFFDYYVVENDKDKKLCTVPSFGEGIIDKEMFLKEFVKDKEIKSFLANKAIKRTFYNGLKFNTETRVAEDYELLTDIALLIKK
ncbi:MAG: glycosyltransferase [Phascolarctobacterium sp.]|nr:glycosyltransferase [Phascolarctobacterium sp.]